MADYKISVIVPLYNHEKYISDCIDSILNQSVPFHELIIINDGSTDGSEQIVRAIKDNRIKYFYQPNQGAPQTLNRAIRLSEGQFISILNSDDRYHPDRFKKFLEIFAGSNRLKALFSDMEYIDEKGVFIKNKDGLADNYFLLKADELSFQEDQDLLLHLLSGNFFATTSNLFCTRDVFSEVGYFSPLKFTHDYDFFLRLCHRYRGEVYYLNQPLLQYRHHSGNTLKTDHRLVYYELAVMYAKFFNGIDLNDLFHRNESRLETMAKFLNSFNRFNYFNKSMDKIVLTALLFGPKLREEDFYEIFLNGPENPFKSAALNRLAQEEHEHIAQYLDLSHQLLAQNNILNSRTFRIGSLIRQAQQNKSQWLLLPFRLIRLLTRSHQ